MNIRSLTVSGFVLLAWPVAAFDDFNLQMSKILHENTSLSHDVYTTRESAGVWDPQCIWFQKPNVALRFNATHQERFGGLTETDLLAPMLDLSFQTYAGVNVGIVYSHGFLSDEQAFPGTFGGSKFEGDIDSVGGYLAKQWDCGFKVGATVAYSTADLRYENGRSFYDFDIVGTSVALGYARSFGEKKFGRNVFVDTSANFLYQSEEDAFYFLWMAKVGHSFSERFAAYGIFNLFHVIDFNGNYVIPEGYVGYHPFGDETWGETGAGFQAQLCHGFTFTAEATTPVLDEQFVATDSFQVRAGLNWRF